MKAALVLRSTVIAVICCTMMVGCKKGCRPKDKTNAEDNAFGKTIPDVGTKMGERGDVFGGPLDKRQFENAHVHFAYDSAAINPSEQSKLQTVADYMKANSAKRLVIEGYCDERGTAEYNRALGERRALAAREALIALGVPADSIQTISYGKDRPVDPGHDEAAWAKNRRDEFGIVQ